MGSCVSKKAARAGAGARDGNNNNVAAPLPAVKEMHNHALSPVAEEEEEVKEVVLSETPIRLPMPPPESPPVKKKTRPQQVSEEEESGSEIASVGSVAKEKTMMAKESKEEQEEVVKRAVVDSPEKALRARRRAARSPSPARVPEEESNKPNQNKQVAGAGNSKNGRARSPSPSRRQQQPPPPPTRPRREQPAVVSAFGCRSGRFSPSAARRAAESAAVRRSHSARDGDMAMSAKRSLAATINGHGNSNAAAALSRRDPGERSGRRANSPTASKRPSPAPSPVHHRQARRAAARDNNSLGGSTPERSRPRVRGLGGGDEQAAFVPGRGGEQKKPEQGALGQNPTVAMECFIFL